MHVETSTTDKKGSKNWWTQSKGGGGKFMLSANQIGSPDVPGMSASWSST